MRGLKWFVKQVWWHMFGEEALILERFPNGGHEYRLATIQDIWRNRPGTILFERMEEKHDKWPR